MTFDVVDISRWPVVSQEAGGDELKDWVVHPDDLACPGHRPQWLYKPVKLGKKTLYRRHDDTAERMASALASTIGLPAAKIELASRTDGDGSTSDGVISLDIKPEGWELHSGDTMLSECEGYVSCAGEVRLKDRPGHNLDNVRRVLEGCAGPPGACQDWGAFEVFAGYLAFDAWIANTDRHALNWAVLGMVVTGDWRPPSITGLLWPRALLKMIYRSTTRRASLGAAGQGDSKADQA